MQDEDKTNPNPAAFDFSRFPADTLFYERRDRFDRREPHQTPAPVTAPVPVLEAETAKSKGPPERRAKKERRRRIDPTTFEKQYTDDEMEFMNAMQRFKIQTGKSFPSHGEVLKVAHSLGYRQTALLDDDGEEFDDDPDDFVECDLQDA